MALAEKSTLRSTVQSENSQVPTWPKTRNHLSLLPSIVNDTPQTSLDFREERRKIVALKAWVMTLNGSKRGYVTDLSEGGACLGGVGKSFRIGERVLLKILLSHRESAVVIRSEVVRHQTSSAAIETAGAQLGLRFVDLNLDEWFRVARYLDQNENKSLRLKAV